MKARRSGLKGLRRVQDALGVAAGGDQPHGRKLRDTGARQVQNTLDPLLEEITHSYVDDDDLTARLNILFEVPPRSQASKRKMQRNRPSLRSFSVRLSPQHPLRGAS